MNLLGIIIRSHIQSKINHFKTLKAIIYSKYTWKNVIFNKEIDIASARGKGHWIPLISSIQNKILFLLPTSLYICPEKSHTGTSVVKCISLCICSMAKIVYVLKTTLGILDKRKIWGLTFLKKDICWPSKVSNGQL